MSQNTDDTRKKIINEVTNERERQIKEEGHSTEDDCYNNPKGELSDAAACYAAGRQLIIDNDGREIDLWPWSDDWWKPKTRRYDLIRSAALIVAEIERLDFLEKEEEMSKKKSDGLTELLSKMIKRVKVISTGRIQCHSTYDVTRLEKEDDGTYTVVLEE